MKKIFLFSLASFCFSLIYPPSYGQELQEKKRALIISNWNYNSLWPALITPQKDGRKLKEILENFYSFDVRLMENQTFSQMGEAFRQLIEESSPDDQLIIYYGGHGRWEEGTFQKQGFWLPVDAGAEKSSWFSNRQVFGLLEKLRSKHVLLLVNSCYSGSFFDNQAYQIPKNSPSRAVKKKSRWGISSSWLFPVKDQGNTGFSPFTGELIQMLTKNYFQGSWLSEKELGEALFQKLRPITHVISLPLRINSKSRGGQLFFIPQDKKENLSHSKSKVTLTSNVGESELYIDGTFWGLLSKNQPFELRLPQGLFDIRVEKNGFQSFALDIEVDNQSQQLEIFLKRKEKNPKNLKLLDPRPVNIREYLEFINSNDIQCDKIPCVDKFSQIHYQKGKWDFVGQMVEKEMKGVTWYGAASYCLSQGKRVPYLFELIENSSVRLAQKEWTLSPANSTAGDLSKKGRKLLSQFFYHKERKPIPIFKVKLYKGLSESVAADQGKEISFRCIQENKKP